MSVDAVVCVAYTDNMTTRYILTLSIPTDATELRADLLTSINERCEPVTAEEAGAIAAEHAANGRLFDTHGTLRGHVSASGAWAVLR